MDLFDYIRDQPGGSAHADWMFAAVDKQALIFGHKLLRLYPHVQELRLKPGTPFIKGRCNQIADAIERDPSGRLVAIPELIAWAKQDDGIGERWIHWYRDHLNNWLAAYPPQRLEAAA